MDIYEKMDDYYLHYSGYFSHCRVYFLIFSTNSTIHSPGRNHHTRGELRGAWAIDFLPNGTMILTERGWKSKPTIR